MTPDEGESISSMLLNGARTKEQARCTAYLSGTGTVEQLLKRFLQARWKFRAEGVRTEAAFAPARALEDILESTRASVLFDALQDYADGAAPDEIHDLCDVISGHGRFHDRETLPLLPEQRASAVSLMNGWARQLLDQGASRNSLGG
ncbi:hypothetical protein [Sinorhizobium meliloti]|uniref:hypothetical protein n=1 Tax=Rhizobium meliloti TaxID=382 RepID=UPI000FDB1A9F|nr:hypothetical protein [Sinorhizobium meliloti]RVM04182.1 hypothetical protein CN134_32060 [Sinorhizobium meliloti]RVO23324.1 hypothetical protein CN098_30110 [Sinorhizobium meliloti]